MTHQLADNYIQYFINHNEFDLLRDFIDRWDAQFNLYEENQKPFIESLILSKQYQRAQIHLRDFLSKSMDTASLAFASKRYLAMNDTILGVYYLSRLHSNAGDHALMYDFGNILFRLGEHERGYEVSSEYRAHHSLNLERAFVIAQHYARHGYLRPAITALQPHCCEDTVSFFISDLYRKSFKFDSSVMYLDSVIIADPTHLKARWKKGRAYEDRGWFSYATRLFEELFGD